MKNKLIVPLLIILSPMVLMAQSVKIEDIPDFDKLVIKGKIKEMIIQPGMGNRAYFGIEGISKDDISYTVSAGILELNIEKAPEPVTLKVYNKDLKRISGPENMKITGAEVIGGGAGNYLVTSFKPGHFGGLVWCKDIDIDVEIPELSLDIDIPKVDFDFPDINIDHDFDIDLNIDQEALLEMQEHLKENQDRIREMSKEWGKEMKQTMEKLQREIEKQRKEN